MFDIELSQENYTSEEVKAILEGIKTNVDSTLTEKDTTIATLQEQVEGIEELKKSTVDSSIKLELVKSGLNEDLFDLVVDGDIEVAKTKISKLIELQKKNVVENSYKPSTHKKEDEYTKAENKGDTKSMIKSKITGLFQ